MKNLKFLFLLLGLIGIQTLKAEIRTPNERNILEILKSPIIDSTDGPYWAWIEQVAGLMQQGAAIDKTKLRKDTTITIYGSGGMDNESGRICPNQSSAQCAKIIIYGLAVIDDAGNLNSPVKGALTDNESKQYAVTVLGLSGARELEDASFSAEGRNVSVKLQ
ncbi:MAG: hypothetical protein KDD02_03925 [Phaeodactylibacter sp.]|nr:hypothetical protein [Phaeodactylibacter sp.]MCB9302042.1 hypothetical protein [Lewinellaceae bacterium]HQU58011.1 hypothetical protein [Saprospiraceae bacterium]